MIVTKLQGGLGNQMFQYAIARRLAILHNTDVWLDTRFYDKEMGRKFNLKEFNIKAKIAGSEQLFLVGANTESHVSGYYKLWRRFIKPIVIKEKILSYDQKVVDVARKHTCLIGYWQTPKYFSDIKDVLLQDFTCKTKPDAINSKMAEEIRATNSISIHIRRGDYVANVKSNMVHGVCSIDYYYRAIEYIQQRAGNCVLYVFSDDMAWVKQNFKVDMPVYYVEHNNNNAIEDMRLMRLCKHNIIANSTFSWWAAWLSANEGKIVVAPQKWYAQDIYVNEDLFVEGWVRI